MDQPPIESPAPRPWPGTQDERDIFAARFMEALKSAGDRREQRYDPVQFQLTVGGGTARSSGAVFNLANPFDIFRKLPVTAREGWLSAYAREGASGTPTGSDLAAVRKRLRPLLRGRTHDDRLRATLGEGAGRLGVYPRVPLGEHHLAGVGVDREASIVEADGAALARWGLSPVQALDQARANLARAFPVPFTLRSPGLYVSATGDGYDAARLLLTDAIRELKPAGDPVALVPHRDLILITGTGEEAGLAAAAAQASEAFEHPRAISGVALRLAGTDWEPWIPPPGHPARRDLEMLAARSVARDYQDQKAALELSFKREKREVFVASLKLYERADGTLTTACTWTLGVRALLPRADIVFFIDPDRPALDSALAIGSWDKVVARAGPRMKAQGLHPERWEVTTFPDARELKSIGKMEP